MRRTRNEVIQDSDVYIGRNMYMGGWKLPKSDWANPFKGEGACEKFEEWLRSRPDLMKRLPEL